MSLRTEYFVSIPVETFKECLRYVDAGIDPASIPSLHGFLTALSGLDLLNGYWRLPKNAN